MGIIIFIILLVAGVSVYDYFDSRNWQNATSTARNGVIFENRNKKYGAYHLRADYNDSMGIIIGIFALCILFFSVISITFRTTPVKLDTPIIDTTLLTIVAPPIEEMKTVKTPYKIIGGGGGGSAGSPSNAPIDKTPEEQVKKENTIDQSDVSVKSGQSNHTAGDNVNNKATTLKQSPNPFNSGGAASGQGSGIFGKDEGSGSGEGNGNGTNGHGGGNGGGGARKKLTNLNPDDIESNIDCKISLTVFINAEGSIVRADINSGKSTTTNAALIAKIRELVIRQIKYDKRPGTAQQKQELTINIKAT